MGEHHFCGRKDLRRPRRGAKKIWYCQGFRHLYNEEVLEGHNYRAGNMEQVNCVLSIILIPPDFDFVFLVAASTTVLCQPCTAAHPLFLADVLRVLARLAFQVLDVLV